MRSLFKRQWSLPKREKVLAGTMSRHGVYIRTNDAQLVRIDCRRGAPRRNLISLLAPYDVLFEHYYVLPRTDRYISDPMDLLITLNTECEPWLPESPPTNV